LAALPILADAAPLQPLSTRKAALPAGGNSGSVLQSLSPDGRFVLFSSSASDLVTNAGNQLGVNVYLRDRAGNSTVLVSANYSGTGAGNAGSVFSQISTNGRLVLFESEASDLIANDTNNVSDIFVRDLQTGTNILVSVAADGGSASGWSSDPVMTPDGRYVAFVSVATNLVAGHSNAIPHLYVRDLVAGTTLWVTAGATPQVNATYAFMSTPAITPDGRYVAFGTTAKGLSPGVPSSASCEIYLCDLVANTTTWVSTNAGATMSYILGLSSNLPSFHPVISDDGRYIAFKTGWTNSIIPPSSGTGAVVVFRYDALGATNVIVGTNGSPTSTWTWWGVDDPYGPEMTPDGRFIAFSAKQGTNQSYSSLYEWDAQSGLSTLVNADTNSLEPANSISHSPALSSDGRFIAFLSSAAGLVTNAVSNGLHLFRRDLQAGVTQLVDADTNNAASTDETGMNLAASADGRYVAFTSPDGRLASRDNNHANDVFLRDTSGAGFELISQRDPSLAATTGNGLSFLSSYSITPDGRFVAFASYSDNLVSNDSNASEDVFVSDLFLGTNFLVSVGVDGSSATGGYSASPVISSNGQFVAFVSTAVNLVPGRSNLFNNIFLRDLRAGTNSLVSVSTSGVDAGNGDAWAPSISSDGRYVAFLSRARNIAPGLSGVGPNTFWRDTISRQTVALAANQAVSNAPSMSADGRYVAYSGSGSQVWVWDSQLAANVYTNLGVVTSFALSPAGTRLLYVKSGVLYVADIAAQSNIFSIPSAVSVSGSAQWSADDRTIGFVTSTNAVSSDSNGTNDVYLCDLTTGRLMLTSVNFAHTASANGPSDSPAISADGRFVVYRSFASNIIAGMTLPPPNIIVYDRYTGSNSLVTTGSAAASWNWWASKPVMTSGGNVIAFQSWDAGLVSNDFNRAQDVFARSIAAAVPPDSDGDGIPDWWMSLYFGHPTGQAFDHSRAQDDADGDGMSNLQEYIAGTVPTDPASVFRVQASPSAPGGSVTLSWPVLMGRSYQVQYKSNLGDINWLGAPGSPTFIGSRGYYGVPPTQLSGFYRVAVSLN
jgi:Tol biopolymer transport system component